MRAPIEQVLKLGTQCQLRLNGGGFLQRAFHASRAELGGVPCIDGSHPLTTSEVVGQMDAFMLRVLSFEGVENSCTAESVNIPSSSYMLYSALISKGGKIVQEFLWHPPDGATTLGRWRQ